MDVDKPSPLLPELSPRERRWSILRRSFYSTVVAAWILLVMWHLFKTNFSQKLVIPYAVISLVIVGAPFFNLGIRTRARACGWRMCPKCYRFGGSEVVMTPHENGETGLKQVFGCGKCKKTLTFEELRMKWSGWL